MTTTAKMSKITIQTHRLRLILSFVLFMGFVLPVDRIHKPFLVWRHKVTAFFQISSLSHILNFLPRVGEEEGRPEFFDAEDLDDTLRLW